MLSVQPDTASISGPTLVTIVGQNLGSGSDITEVYIASHLCTIVSQSDSTVVVRTPAISATGKGSVLIRSASQGTATVAGAFTFVDRASSSLSTLMRNKRGAD